MKIRKAFTFLLGLLLGIAIISVAGALFVKVRREQKGLKRYDAVAPAGSETTAGSRIFTASSLDRIFQDGKTLLPPSLGNEAKLSAARNEYEAFQIVVQTGDQPLSSVTLEVSAMALATSDERPATGDSRPILLDWSVVGYVPTEQPYYPTKYVGQWPDYLMPSHSPSGVVVGTDISPNTTQPFWVSVYVPDTAFAGEWRGEIAVRSQGEVLKKIPVQLTVHPFALPTAASLKTAFDFYGHMTHKRYPQKANETTENYDARIDAINIKFQQMMLQYRMNPIINVDPTDNKQLAFVDRLRILGLNNFSIGKRGGTFNNNWPGTDKDIEALLPLYRTYGEMLKLNKLLPYTYIYTWDEGEIGNPAVAKISGMIHRAYPGLKNMVCYHGLWDPAEHAGWGKDIDIWCFNIDDFVESKFRALQKMGMEMWMYISGPSGSGSPNLCMDFDSIDYRIVPWLCWKYDIKGFLYWSVNYWELGKDPFVTARNVKWEQNANGLLFYPGPDGPWPSLRAEIFRDGMEDYEYIQILLKRLIEIKKQGLNETNEVFYEEAKKLLMVDDSIAESLSKFNKDARVIMERRQRIGEKIGEAEEILREIQ